MYVQKHGAADLPVVILVHGAGGTHLNWPPLLRRLSGYCVYALDLPGHGRSSGQVCNSVSAYSAVLNTWMESVGIAQAVIVGHSMGSAIALNLALEYPERVLALGLIGSAASLAVNPTLLELASSSATYLRAVELVVKWSFSRYTPARLVELSARRLAEVPSFVLYQDFLACNTFDVAGRAGEIPQPAVLICGEEDRMTPPKAAYALLQALPAAQLEIIPAAGHMVMLEKPQEVANALLRFLSGV